MSDLGMALLGSLADIRSALWFLDVAVGFVAATILTHALVVRKRKR